MINGQRSNFRYLYAKFRHLKLVLGLFLSLFSAPMAASTNVSASAGLIECKLAANKAKAASREEAKEKFWESEVADKFQQWLREAASARRERILSVEIKSAKNIFFESSSPRSLVDQIRAKLGPHLYAQLQGVNSLEAVNLELINSLKDGPEADKILNSILGRESDEQKLKMVLSQLNQVKGAPSILIFDDVNSLYGLTVEERKSLFHAIEESPFYTVFFIRAESDRHSLQQFFEQCRMTSRTRFVTYLASGSASSLDLPRYPELPDTGYELEYSEAARDSADVLLHSHPSVYRQAIRALTKLSEDPHTPSLNSKKLISGSTVARLYGKEVYRSVVTAGHGGYRIVWRYKKNQDHREITVLDIADHSTMD